MRKVAYFLWSFAATIVGHVYGVVMTIVCSIAAILFLLFRLYRPVMWVEKFWGASIFLSLGKIVHIEGRDRIEKGKPYIIVCNHASVFDILAAALIVKDFAAFVAKESLFRVPIFGGALSLGVCIPIDRRNPMKAGKAIDNAKTRMQQKQSIILFPEGTRTEDGNIGKFKRGFVRLMRETGYDVLPVTLNGFFKLKPSYSIQPYIYTGSRLEIVIHDPVPSEKLIDSDDRAIAETVRGIIEAAYKNPASNG